MRARGTQRSSGRTDGRCYGSQSEVEEQRIRVDQPLRLHDLHSAVEERLGEVF